MGGSSRSFETLLRQVAAAPEIEVPPQYLAGSMIAGRYRILGQRGRGAMGVVYEVHDEHLDERVALKLLHVADPEYQKGLRREVRLGRRVSHPNVCRIHDLGSEGDRLFIAMELLSGASLRSWIEADRSIPLARCVDVLVQIAAGLAAAHRAGVIHRDVKPENVVLDGDRAVLTDFGVASPARGTASVAGTPAYMAPELAAGEPHDRRVDTYSFAVMAYELLAGGRPFGISSVAELRELAGRGLVVPRLPAHIAAAEVREALEAVLRRALVLDPARRPDPVDAFATLLARAARGESLRPSPGRRHRRATTAGRAATALVASFTAGHPDGESLERPVVDLGGTIVAIDGTRLEALFGAPRSRGDDAIRAARAALALAASCPDAAVAVHTGRVELATDDRGALVASGAALDVARELIGSGGVTCSRETWAQLAARFCLTPIPGGGYRLDERGEQDAALVAPLAGRTDELAALQALARETFEERRAGFARIVGPAGIGKTRLVTELLDRVRARRDLEVIAIRAAPFSEVGTPPLLRQIMPAAERTDRFREWLLDRAARRPLILVADDLHWADPLSRQHLGDLERQLDEAAVLGLFIARDGSALWPAGPRSLELTLAPLEEASARALVAAVAPLAGEDATRRALERGAGNPLLLEELGRALREGRNRLPDTVVAAAQEQLDRLPDGAGELARCAAVLGGDFAAAQVVDLAGAGASAAALDDLIERGVLVAQVDERGEVRYRFASPLVRDTAYQEISGADRARLHAAAARILESQGGDDPTDLRAIADHWERAGDARRAREVCRLLGERALARFDLDEAAAALSRVERLADSDELDIDLLTKLGLALEHRDGAAAERRFEAAFRATTPGDPVRARLCLYLGRCATGRSDNDAARRWYERGLVEVETSAPEELTTVAALNANLGSLLGYIMHDNTTGLELSERAVSLLEGTEHRRELAQALSRLGGNYMRAGRWRDQLACNQRNLDIALELGDLTAELTARINLGEVHKSLGEIEAAARHTRTALGLCRRVGNSAAQALALSNLGALEIERGDLEGGEERIRAGIDLGRRAGYERFFYESYSTLSRARHLRGDHEAAEELARRAVGVALTTGSRVIEGIVLRFLAAAVAAGGRREEALGHLRRAHQCLADRDPYEDARTSVVEARVLRRGGDFETAAALLEAAAEVFARLGAALDLANLEVEGDLR